MKVEQLSIFLENEAGRLSEVTNALAVNNINIRALSLADTSDFGILRIIVDNTEKAKQALKDAGLTVGVTPVVAVKVADVPGGLDNVMQLLSKKDINVEYMYAFVDHTSKNASLILRFDKVDEAIEFLKENNIEMITAKQISM